MITNLERASALNNYNTYVHAIRMERARKYVNALLKTDKQTNNEINTIEKTSVTKKSLSTELKTVLTKNTDIKQTVNSQIDSRVGTKVSEVVDAKITDVLNVKVSEVVATQLNETVGVRLDLINESAISALEKANNLQNMLNQINVNIVTVEDLNTTNTVLENTRNLLDYTRNKLDDTNISLESTNTRINEINEAAFLALEKSNNLQNYIDDLNLTAYNAVTVDDFNSTNMVLRNLLNNTRNILDDTGLKLEVTGLKLEVTNIKLNEINEKLLKKINYLFEMLYHTDSETLMENYPLSD
jgi:hypothetical protein